MNEPKDGPDPVDIAVGVRVRLLRKARDISQSKLADAIGVSFQQVQKYERGANRISISMLARIARALGTTIPELVDERADNERPFEDVMGLMSEPGMLELVRAFGRIAPGAQRRAVLDLARTLAERS